MHTPIMALYEDKLSTTENCTFRVIGPAWMGSTTSPSEVVVAPLKLDNRCPGFSKVDGE